MSGPTPEPSVDSPPPPPDRAGRRLSPLTPLVRSFLFVLVAAASTWQNLVGGRVGPIAWALLAVLLVGAAAGALSWLRTTYWIEADELRVDTGIVSRQSRRIRVDRLQGIDIAQPFVARLFGLAELRMDVAGGGSREGSLAFLSLPEARELRETLLARRDAVRAGAPSPAAEPGSPTTGRDPGDKGTARPAPQAAVGRRERVVARLDLGTLLVSLLLSTQLVGFVVAAVVIGVGFAFFGQAGGLVGVVPVVVGFVATQFRRLSAFYGFEVSESESGLHVSRGLFERNAQTIALARVQGVVVSEPLLWRGLGWARLDVSLAGSSHGGQREGEPAASTVMPVAPRADVLGLARLLLAEAGSPDPEEVALTPPPDRARWAAPVLRRFMAGGLGERLVVSREGVLTRHTHVVPHARVQSLQVRQGPWQARLGLADLQVDSPPGPVGVRLRHRDAREARAWLEQEDDRARRARLAPGTRSGLAG